MNIIKYISLCLAVSFIVFSNSVSAADPEDVPNSLRTRAVSYTQPYSAGKFHFDGSATFWRLDEETRKLSAMQITQARETKLLNIEATDFAPFNADTYAYVREKTRTLKDKLKRRSTPKEVIWTAHGLEFTVFTAQHPTYDIDLVEGPDPTQLYFTVSRAFTEKNKPCDPEHKSAVIHSTEVYHYLPARVTTESLGIYPIHGTPVWAESNDLFFCSEREGHIIITKANRETPADLKPVWSHDSRFLSTDSLEIVLRKNGQGIYTLLPGTTEREMFIPYYVNFADGKRQPLLSGGEQDALLGNVASFILDPTTDQLMAYATHGLSVEWHTPASSPELAYLATTLARLQEGYGQNLLFLSNDDLVGYFENNKGVFKSFSPVSDQVLLLEGGEDTSEESSFFSSTESDAPPSGESLDTSNYNDTAFFYCESKFTELEGVETLTFSIDGRHGYTIPTYVIRPPGELAITDGIVFIHGGPATRTTLTIVDFGEFRYFASLGYTVVVPQFSGSNGFGEDFARGRWDHTGRVSDDIIDATRWCVNEGLIHADRTALVGGSYGGYMTALLLTIRKDEFPYLGGFAHAGFYNRVASQTRDLSRREVTYLHLLQDHGSGQFHNPSAQKQMLDSSPIHFAKQLEHPLVIVHGTKDENCSYKEAQQLSKVLKTAKAPHSLLKLKGEGHGTSTKEMSAVLLFLQETFLSRLFGTAVPDRLTEEETKNAKAKVKVVHDSLGFYPKGTIQTSP